MDNIISQKEILEKQAIYSKDLKKRFELSISKQGKKGKSILVLCLNPTSINVQISDTTTNYLMNNLFPLGYSTITICNLFATICSKLNANAINNNDDNAEFIKEVLNREFQTVLIGYGNTFTSSKQVSAEKALMEKLISSSGKKAVELVDKEEVYSRLKTIHPLFAGQRFSGNWKFRKHIAVDEIEKKEEK